jgi:hypothetical protein
MSLVGKYIKQVVDGLLALMKATGTIGGVATAASGYGALAGIAMVKVAELLSGLGEKLEKMAARGETLKAFVMYGMKMVQDLMAESAYFYMMCIELYGWFKALVGCASIKYVARIWRYLAPKMGFTIEQKSFGSDGGPVACCSRDLMASILDVRKNTRFNEETGGVLGRTFNLVSRRIFGSSSDTGAGPGNMLSVNLVIDDGPDEESAAASNFKFDSKANTKRLRKILRERAAEEV